MGKIYSENPFFIEFLKPDISRHDLLFAYLQASCQDRPLYCQSITIDKKRHILLRPQEPAKIKNKALIVLVAHYDRHSQVPGANDNSAAVLQLAEASRRLIDLGIKNWLCIFTDSEESAAKGGATSQGSYSLGLALAHILAQGNMPSFHIYILDACGRGESIILSTTVDRILSQSKGNSADSGRSELAVLRGRAMDCVKSLPGQDLFLAATPFSDDLGLLRAGFIGQTITLLPKNEAQKLIADTNRNATNSQALIVQSSQTEASIEIPETWRLFHSPKDNIHSLSDKSWDIMLRFIVQLVRGP